MLSIEGYSSGKSQSTLSRSFPLFFGRLCHQNGFWKLFPRKLLEIQEKLSKMIEARLYWRNIKYSSAYSCFQWLFAAYSPNPAETASINWFIIQKMIKNVWPGITNFLINFCVDGIGRYAKWNSIYANLWMYI